MKKHNLFKKRHSQYLLALLSLFFIVASCKKETNILEQPSNNKIKGKGNRSRESASLPTFKEFIFDEKLLDYSTIFNQERDNIKRSIIRYYKPSYDNIKLYKYLLVETNSDNTWKSAYLVSINKLFEGFDLFNINFRGGEVINLDKLREGLDYIVNGVQVAKKVYRLNETIISSQTDDMAPACGQEQCYDSWLVTYNVETGDIVWIEYSPICHIVPCGGGGGGNPASPPEICDPSAKYPEEREFNDYVQMAPSSPVNITAKFSPPRATNEYFSGTLSWNVVKGAFANWSVRNTFNYGYTRVSFGSVFNDNIEHYYTFDKFKTISTEYIGSNNLIKSTYTGTAIDEVFNNDTRSAFGFITVVGSLRHIMECPKRLPFCLGLVMDQTDPIANSLTYYPK